MRGRAAALVLLGLLVGGALGYGVGRTLGVRRSRVLADRVAMLGAQADQVQAERDRLHHEIGEPVRARRGMADTAKRLRAQTDQPLRRREATDGARAGGSGAE